MDDGELRRIAAASGIRGKGMPSFEQVERRRFELWLLSTVLLVGMTGALGLLTMWSPDEMDAVLRMPGVRFGAVGLALVMSVYSIEKERQLRRISRLLTSTTQLLASELAHAATHDSLTGLGNRAALQGRADGSQALLFIDLDGFKDVNDRYGHVAGDQVLVAVARRIAANVAAGDLVVRFGGDEFAILLEDVDDEQLAAQIGGRIRAAIDRPINVGTSRLHVTASIGVAVPAVDHNSLDDLLRDADAALYAAKAAGKACLVVHPSIPSQRLAPTTAGR